MQPRKRIYLRLAATVVVLIGLASFAVAKYRQLSWESGESARAVRCASNMRMIGQALQLYADKHGGRLPSSLEALKLEDHRSLDCPSNRTTVTSYRYIGAGVTIDAARDTVILYEQRPLHGNFVNALHLDGSVSSPREAELKQLLRLQLGEAR